MTSFSIYDLIYAAKEKAIDAQLADSIVVEDLLIEIIDNLDDALKMLY